MSDRLNGALALVVCVVALQVIDLPAKQPADPEPAKPAPIEVLPEPKPEPKPEPEPVAKNAVIEFYTTTTFYCPPCEAFKKLIPGLKATGWKVETRPGTGAVPYFYVWINGKKSGKVTGLMGYARLRRVMEGMTGQPVVPRYSAVAARPVYVDNYEPRWTWPGDLRSHLQGSPHFVDTTGMSQDDMERLHDSLHEGSRTVRRVVTPRRYVRSG